MPLAELDLAALRRWVLTARADLEAYAEELNRLNVFPVPDADTGSNLLMTMSDAVDELDAQAPDDIAAATAAMAQATLIAARGNSGVILSQLARGMSEVVGEVGQQPFDGHRLAAVLTRAARLAQESVSAPVPGTILTVAAAAAEAAEAVGTVGSDEGNLAQVVDAAVAGAADAVLRTRTQNSVLRRAGVVDAGGAGYLLVLEALQRVVHGSGGLATTAGTVPEWLRISRTGDPAPRNIGCEAGTAGSGPSYEVMFLLDEATAESVAALRTVLDGLGDSLVVAGGPGQHSVHVHTDDVSAALNAAAAAGRPHRFRITRLADAAPACPAAGSVVLALVSGAGMAQLVSRTAVRPVLDWQDPQLLRPLLGPRTLLLCGSPAACEVARQLTGRHRVEVVGDNVVDVVAAAAVIDTSTDFERMCRVARDAVADIRSERVVGDPGQDALMHLVSALLRDRPSAELLTLVAGAELSQERMAQLVHIVRSERPQLDIAQVTGGGHDALLTVGVE